MRVVPVPLPPSEPMTSEIENGHNGEIETARRKDGIRNENIDALMAAVEKPVKKRVRGRIPSFPCERVAQNAWKTVKIKGLCDLGRACPPDLLYKCLVDFETSRFGDYEKLSAHAATRRNARMIGVMCELTDLSMSTLCTMLGCAPTNGWNLRKKWIAADIADRRKYLCCVKKLMKI